ncbi:hypothetical protein JANAI62_00550 [Jannaschia pagri]|uniref:Hemolysin-type calcium-binding repeat-containing protein n=1 Tax=Jannaschia pagri TaxID=2829797 RepID=A0ABQ4NH64_9RHOB|nr:MULTISPECIES: calcium-binding protein [unclassified Jannaschia]GIT90463.1 hypothetical protein JANAI61_09210 [Jannaschia sp. AI_61]GIT93432.1 hypothetical protein JANAI62_00550 [Jannaschia sp. AI_62]
MTSFNILSTTSIQRSLTGSEHGFIAQGVGIIATEPVANATPGVTIKGTTNTLTVLGFINNGTDSSVSFEDANGAFVTIGSSGSVTSGAVAAAALSGTFVGNGIRMTNAGLISNGLGNGVLLTAVNGSTSVVDIFNTTTGILQGAFTGLELNPRFSRANVVNDGLITGGVTGVNLTYTEFATSTQTVNNSGDIVGGQTGLFITASFITPLKVTNTGVISGGQSGAAITSRGTIEFVNSGTLSGSANSLTLEGARGNATILNSGNLVGDVQLGSGADVFDTRGGTVTGTVNLGDGADTVLLDDASVTLVGGGGVDLVRSWVGYHMRTSDLEQLVLEGTEDLKGAGNSGNNVITGNVGDNALFGFAGNDTLLGQEGNDKLFGSAGVDNVSGGDGDDWIHGGADRDVLQGGSGNDLIQGGTGDDVLDGGEGRNTLEGGVGDDIIIAGVDAETIHGGQGEDLISFAGSLSRVVVNIGVNFTSGGAAEGDVISGFEQLVGSNFDDVLVGSSGNNVISGQRGADRLRGEAGEDSLTGGAGADTLDGGTGADLVSYQFSQARVIVNLETGFTSGGDAAGDVLISIERAEGSNLNDRIVGSTDGNRLFGLDGEDYLDGAAGSDIIEGGRGNDDLLGGAGADRFVFGLFSGNDRILDFEDGSDIIDLRPYNVLQFSDLALSVDDDDLLINIGGFGTSIRLVSENGQTVLTEADFLFS